MRRWSRFVLPFLVVGFLASPIPGCGGALKPPPQITAPADVRVWQANEAVIGLRALMQAAIALNETQVCDASNSCHPALSEPNTRVVVQAVRTAVAVIGEVPAGWPAAASTALSQVEYFVSADQIAKLRPYIAAAQAVLAQLGGQ